MKPFSSLFALLNSSPGRCLCRCCQKDRYLRLVACLILNLINNLIASIVLLCDLHLNIRNMQR